MRTKIWGMIFCTIWLVGIAGVLYVNKDNLNAKNAAPPVPPPPPPPDPDFCLATGSEFCACGCLRGFPCVCGGEVKATKIEKCPTTGSKTCNCGCLKDDPCRCAVAKKKCPCCDN